MGQLLVSVSLIMGIVVYSITIYQFFTGNYSLRRLDRYQAKKRQNEPSLVLKTSIRKNYLGCIMTFLIIFLIFFGGIHLLDLDLEIEPIVIFGISLFVASASGIFVLGYSRRYKP